MFTSATDTDFTVAVPLKCALTLQTELLSSSFIYNYSSTLALQTQTVQLHRGKLEVLMLQVAFTDLENFLRAL